MTVGEFQILAELDRWGPLTAFELHKSDRLRGVRTWQGKVANLLQLERRGFVHRKDPAAHIWDLTDRAREVLAL